MWMLDIESKVKASPGMIPEGFWILGNFGNSLDKSFSVKNLRTARFTYGNSRLILVKKRSSVVSRGVLPSSKTRFIIEMTMSGVDEEAFKPEMSMIERRFSTTVFISFSPRMILEYSSESSGSL